MTHICVSKQIKENIKALRQLPSMILPWSAPSHYLNQCWNIVNWKLRTKVQWNFNRNSNIFIQENGFESVVCEMAAILSQPQCVKDDWPFPFSELILPRNINHSSWTNAIWYYLSIHYFIIHSMSCIKHVCLCMPLEITTEATNTVYNSRWIILNNK